MCETTDPGSWRLDEAVVSASRANTFDEARHEWDVVEYWDASPGGEDAGTGVPESCVCGHYPIVDCFKIRNRLTGAVLEPIGNVCVHRFSCPDMEETARDLKSISRLRANSGLLGAHGILPIRRDEATGGIGALSRATIKALYLRGGFDPRGEERLGWHYSAADAYAVVLKAFNARRADETLMQLAHKFVESRVRPWLAELSQRSA